MNIHTLRNLVGKTELKKQLAEENFKRITLSFYRYTKIDKPEEFRNELFQKWQKLNIFGRIYIATEGINAQLSVPETNLDKFKEQLEEDFPQMPLKIAVEDDGKSFYKLCIKTKEKIVADGLDDKTFDSSNVGKHLTAEEFNQEIDKGAIVVDMRNHYESEIGHFQNAICPDADTFREELPMVKKELDEKKHKKILLYCTGGIRCEKASAYLKHHGFKDVNQLHGGIIDYARQIKAQKITSKFKGKNFVFDERIAEKISDEIISKCHQCGNDCDTHTNCANADCHLLFIQCEDCAEKLSACCTKKCQEISTLSPEEQKTLRSGQNKKDCLSVYKSRLRPKLSEISNIS
ncbi:rhodanese-related sulfurtransferase [Candidatus Gracilibacteria bacterium]|nr:rhodanese-related sulfurtransferase [Candidatus Gracilibacteria bacterium]